MGKANGIFQRNKFRNKYRCALLLGAPAKPPFRLCGERRGSGMSELSPKAKVKDMKLAPTQQGFFAPSRGRFRHKTIERKI